MQDTAFITLGHFNENVTAGLIVPCLSPYSPQAKELLEMNGSKEGEYVRLRRV